MTASLYVQAAHHEVLPVRERHLEPRARFVEYQEDLHRIAGLTLDRSSLTRGDQYTYVELADTLFSTVGHECLRDLGVLVISYWTPEFDPDISAFGPYLHHRYSLGCHSFDLIDRGSISPVLALLVLGEYLLADERSGNGALLGVEQSTVPVATGANFPGPARSSAGLLRLSRHPRGSVAEILGMAMLSEDRVLDPAFGIAALTACCGQADIDPADLTIAIRRDTFLYRSWSRQLEGREWPCRIRFLPAESSCMALFGWLSAELAAGRDGDTRILFVDEDVESLAAAAVLVKVTGS
jgi:hypothetical protein